VVLDVMLPRLDGYKICAMLKSDKHRKQIPIIMFTARTQEADIQKGQEAKADAYISKPFDPNVLLQTINELL